MASHVPTLNAVEEIPSLGAESHRNFPLRLHKWPLNLCKSRRNQHNSSRKLDKWEASYVIGSPKYIDFSQNYAVQTPIQAPFPA